MAGRIRWLLAFLRQDSPRGAPPSAWALVFDAVVAVAAALGAVYEMTQRDLSQVVILPLGSSVTRRVLLPLAGRGQVVFAGPTHASAWFLVGAALTALPLAWRRLYPVLAWLAVIAAIVAVHRVYVPPVALGTAVYAAYSAFVHSRYRNLAIAVVSVTTVFAAVWIGDALPRLPGKVTAVVAILAATVAGIGIRSLRQRLASSAAQLRRAAADAQAATERALAAERSRIASELHDVVTHNVSVMIVQAGAARKIMALSPADAQDALLAVESTGREAMTELRNLLGLLSPAADGSEATARASMAPEAAAAALRPQPGLGELETLIGRVAAAGLPVSLSVDGVPRPLSPGADLAAYRVVQEGLTNVLRHAGQATATVRVSWAEALEIMVSDDGQGTVPAGSGGMPSAGGFGRGLLGLRERLSLYDGELIAGPRSGGGWRLRAILPLPKQTAPDAPVPVASVPGMISAEVAG